MNENAASRLVRIATLVLGCVFFVGAYLKAVRPSDTMMALETFSGEGSSLAAPAAYVLIAVEIVLGAALLTNLAPRLTLRLSFILLLVFTGWIAWLLMIGWTKGCGCGSWTPGLDPAAALWISAGRNALLLALAGAGFRAAQAPDAAHNSRSLSHGKTLSEPPATYQVDT